MALISREIVYLLSLITAWTSNSNADNRILSKLGTFELPPNWLIQAWKSNKIGPDQSVHASLRATLVAGREKEGELATTSLEFEYLHRNSRCKMLIGGYNISNDVITLGTYFSTFVYIRALSFVHPFVRSFVGSFACSFIHSLVRSFIYLSVVRSLVHSLVRMFVHSFVSSFVHLFVCRSFVRSFVGSYVCSFIR